MIKCCVKCLAVLEIPIPYSGLRTHRVVCVFGFYCSSRTTVRTVLFPSPILFECPEISDSDICCPGILRRSHVHVTRDAPEELLFPHTKCLTSFIHSSVFPLFNLGYALSLSAGFCPFHLLRTHTHVDLVFRCTSG